MSFGRRYTPDPRDRQYPMRLLLDPLRELAFPRGLPEGSSYHRPGPVWIQGSTGTCVEHGWRHAFECGPVMQQLPMPQFEFYKMIILGDEWSDNDHEASGPVSGLQFGTSVRAGAEGGIKLGLIKSYLWAESMEDVRGWLLAKLGPLVSGTVWKTGMMDTDSEGFIRATGQDEGGHCVMWYGWNDFVRHNGRRVRAIRGQQSWELPWGHGGQGRMWCEEDDFWKLMSDQGEVCAYTEIRVKPLKLVA